MKLSTLSNKVAIVLTDGHFVCPEDRDPQINKRLKIMKNFGFKTIKINYGYTDNAQKEFDMCYNISDGKPGALLEIAEQMETQIFKKLKKNMIK